MPLPDLRTMMSELVALPSISSEDPRHDQGNVAVIDRLEQWLAPLGFCCERIAVPGRPEKQNLIAALGRGPGGLVLGGHADTVPCDAQGWTADPFVLTERDGRLHGLGICDMKGFLAMAVQVASELAESGTEPRRPLIVLATADEESGMDGARALLAAGRPKARYAVIGEPTGMRPVRMHKGILMDRIRVLGRSGHSSRPDLGANAIEGMHAVLGELLAWRDELAGRRSGLPFALDWPTINPGSIHGGDSANRIPACCELCIDLRFPPGENLDALRAELRERLSSRFDRPGMHLEFETLFDGVPAMATDPDSPLVAACERLTGHAAEAVDFATEGSFYQRLGMDAVILGPGDIEVAHRPDEYLQIERIDPMLGVLRALVARFCLQPEDEA